MPTGQELLGNALDALSGKKKTEEIKKEEPIVEEVKAEVEEKVEDNKEVLSNTEEIKKEIVEDKVEEPIVDKPEEGLDFWKLASEKLGREVKSQEDLIIEKEIEKVVEKELEYGSEFSKAYDKFFKDTGRSPQEYLLANRDLSTISKEQVVRESLKAENPTLDQGQLNFLYKNRYQTNEDEMTEDDIMLKKIQFEQDYSKGIRSMEAIQKDYAIPQDNSIASKEAQNQQNEQAALQQQKVWEDLVGTTNSEISGLNIELDDFKYSHPIDATAKSKLKDIASDSSMTKWVQRYQKPDGTVDVKTLQEDIYVRDNVTTLLKEAFEQGKAVQKEAELKQDKHIDFKSGAKPEQGQKFSKKVQMQLDMVKSSNPKLYAEILKKHNI